MGVYLDRVPLDNTIPNNFFYQQFLEQYSNISSHFLNLEHEEKEELKALIKEGYDINFVRFTPNTVVPEIAQGWKGAEHMYSFDYAYKLKSVRDWLFKQRKNK